jgi:pyruvate-ferredoxin/flavodoxin oxidoreductase
LPASSDRKTDIHRFWEQTGTFYLGGRPNDNLADPFNAMSLIPASTGVYRDMTQIRFHHPQWVPENCTACGDCFTVCPDSAIPGIACSVADAFETTIKRVEKTGEPTKHLRRAVRTVEKKLRTSTTGANGKSVDVAPLLDHAITATIAEAAPTERGELEAEFTRFRGAMGGFKFSLTKPYYNQKEKKQAGSGGLFAITVNPYTCKGCMLCVDVCSDEALISVPQTDESVETLREEWGYWQELPSTPQEFSRIDDFDEKIGALETMLMDKSVYSSMVCGDGACTGCGEKSVLHIFTATITTLMQRRVKQHVAHVSDLIAQLEQHIKMKLADTVDVSNAGRIHEIIAAHQQGDLKLSELAGELDQGRGAPLDQDWLSKVTGLLQQLKDLKWNYEVGVTNTGRANMGFTNATGCSSVYGSSFPYNPYPFPWTNHLFQDAPSVAIGVFEGHMVKMADGFKAIRLVEAELRGESIDQLEKDLTYFNWSRFTDEEFLLCPPVVAVGGDGAMYDIGFQNMSRALMSGRPIKILVLDTQVYSNTGGQACTSGFIGQVSDMAPYGKAWHGKTEARKEMSLIGAAHRTAFVLQTNLSNYTHMIEGFIDGLNTRRPALFNVYTPCQPEHAIADDASFARAKMALESRAYPILRFDPDAGDDWESCIDLSGNPAMDEDWLTYTLRYEDEDGNEQSMELPMTFADFAVGEGRFRKHFRVAPPDTWNENMLPIAEFLALPEDEREGMFPYVWAVNKKNRLIRVLVAEELVKSCEERQSFWQTLRALAGLTKKVDPEAIANQVRAETAQKLTAGLMAMLGGEGGAAAVQAGLASMPASGGAPAAEATPEAAAPAAAGGAFEPVWIEKPECTSCDECVNLNPKIFAYDENKKAYVKDPRGGPFKDIVRAAEKCTGQCIHPGTPADPNEKDLDKWVKRAEKYQ